MQKYYLGLFLGVSLLFTGCNSNSDEYPLNKNNTPYTLEESKQKKILIEEFSDIQCPACKAFAPVYEKIEKDFPQVEFRFYHYPLESIHPYAFSSAIAVECASSIAGIEKRSEYLHLVFRSKSLKKDSLKEIAKNININIEKFNKCLDNKETKDVIKAHVQEGDRRSLSATPTLFFNGEVHAGGMSYDLMYSKVQKLIDESK
jgi:protein-disulfide isomerase